MEIPTPKTAVKIPSWMSSMISAIYENKKIGDGSKKNPDNRIPVYTQNPVLLSNPIAKTIIEAVDPKSWIIKNIFFFP